MRKGVRVIAIIAVVLVLGAVGLASRVFALRSSLRKAAAADERQAIRVDGVQRRYLLHVPKPSPGGRPAPLVLVFHGGGGHDWNMPGLTHFDALSDQEGFFVAYPDSVNGRWSDGRGLSPADDVGFVRALIHELERSHPIDPHRIYATGISSGGFFSNRLACDLTDEIAAIASVAATLPEPFVPLCRPSRPISVMYLNGTEDPLVPMDGGKIGFPWGRSHGQCISLAAATQFWREQDHALSEVPATDLPELVNDGTHIRRAAWTGGRDDSEVVVYTIKGGGHTWPGGPQYLPPLVVGKASQNLDGARAIWEFFRLHARP
jgi:polyhydroxybutyrate depolymerase